MLPSYAVSAILNAVLLAGVPFLCFLAFHKFRHKRSLSEVVGRAGMGLGDTKYLWHSLAFAILVVAGLMIWPPSIELFAREGSPQQAFVGLGLGSQSILMALLYGVVKTGYPEEYLFRGLIAGSLGRRLPLVWANILQALIFLLPHLAVLTFMPEAWPMLPLVFLGGLYVGWIRIRSGSFFGPFLIHAVANVTTCLSVAVRSV